jgi:signal peptidase II
MIAGGVKFLAAIVLPLYLLDQLSKWWIYTHLALIPTQDNWQDFRPVIEATIHLPQKVEVIPGWFELVHWGNTGAAFSLGRGNNALFIGISVVAFIALLIGWKKNVFPDRLSKVAVALILAGILGNVTDRLLHGYVVDFLSFFLHLPFKWANPWPAFNVADSCIFIAAVLFIIAGIRDTVHKKAAEKAGA